MLTFPPPQGREIEMADGTRPTEPGYYWLQDGGWQIVYVYRAGPELVISYCGVTGVDSVDLYQDDQWGGKIVRDHAASERRFDAHRSTLR